ncbi:MAG: serine acetyltransferase [Phycisphaera sp.]|nr:serine acetyltransferase [Phycisphaera sp.]
MRKRVRRPRYLASVHERSTDACLAHLSAVAARGASTPPPPCERQLIEATEALRALVFPPLRASGAHGDALARQVVHAFEDLVRAACAASGATDDGARTAAFFAQIPAIAARLELDVRAAFEGDPAAQSELEVVVCYPGVRALFVHRVAHALDLLGVPLLPRMMAEYAHRETGIDIHPRAQIGDAVFIDHGTGVVVGETASIGHRCRIYQGVTLGAKSFEREPDGSMRRGYKRHPTLEDDVVVYAGATILGGDTVIGKGSVVAGGVFLTKSVPAGHVVTGPKLELRMISMGGGI